MKRVIVRLENVTKSFDGKKKIIDNLSLDVYEKEFLTLLGPSGCGKTTILRMISGLDSVTSGKVFIDDIDVTNVEATDREVNTIFQNLAIFPHMNVFDNVAFGLKMKHVQKDEINKRVLKTLDLVELKGYEDRMPSQLSGGQLQRVAIARGIIMNPKVLLLDESLCSLDLKLKRAMQIELKKIQKRLGITFIYVTHDQDEALTMSDRIVIINNGIIEQNDTPQNIYMNPNTVFVADFIGESNIIKAKITNVGTVYTEIELLGNSYKIPVNDNDVAAEEIDILIRPENINIYSKMVASSFKATINDIIYDGAISKMFVTAKDNVKLRVNLHGIYNYLEKQEIYLQIPSDKIVPIRGNNNYEK